MASTSSLSTQDLNPGGFALFSPGVPKAGLTGFGLYPSLCPSVSLEVQGMVLHLLLMRRLPAPGELAWADIDISVVVRKEPSSICWPSAPYL